MVLESLKHTGYRAIIGSGWTGLGNAPLPKNIFRVGETYHGSLFPRLAGILHHGGSGTTHTAAKSGIPQFIVPRLADQHYWGNRVYKMGMGPRPIPLERLNADRLTESLTALMENREYTRRAMKTGEDMQDENGVSEIVSIIERHTAHLEKGVGVAG